MCGWAMVHDGKFSLSSRYHHGKKTRETEEFFFAISFHFIQVCTPTVPNGTFLFRGFHPVLESQQIMSISDGQVSC